MSSRRVAVIFLVLFGCFLIATAGFYFFLRSILDTKPTVKKDSVLKLELSGLITEHFPSDVVAKQLEGANLQLLDIYRALEMAKVDKRIRGVYLRVSGPQLGWAKAQEIRELLQDFAISGKFVVAFMPTCDELAYYVAHVADEVYLQPHSTVEFNGLASEVPFLKRTLNKLGIHPQVENIGKYKSAGDILKRDSMSEAHREAVEAVLSDTYETFATAVSEARNLSRAEFEALLDQGLYDAEAAFEAGLVDSLVYETQVLELMKRKIYGLETPDLEDKDIHFISVGRYSKLSPQDVGIDPGEKFALIYGIGSILPGQNDFDPLAGRTMGSESTIRMLRAAHENESIKAIVLRVDSPGGSGLASDMIWSEIERIKQDKPVIVSMSDVAASGGYWVSMNSHAIVAQPTTITGSIGVVFAVFDLSGTYDKLGLVWETVKTNPHADMLTDKRPLSEQERQTLHRLTYDFYRTFVRKAAESRSMSWEDMHDIAQGRVWTGLRARKHGLVDTLGGLSLAARLAKQRAGIDEELAIDWVVYPKPKGFWESLMSDFAARAVHGSQELATRRAILNLGSNDLASALQIMARLQRRSDGPLLAILPYTPHIR